MREDSTDIGGLERHSGRKSGAKLQNIDSLRLRCMNWALLLQHANQLGLEAHGLRILVHNCLPLRVVEGSTVVENTPGQSLTATCREPVLLGSVAAQLAASSFRLINSCGDDYLKVTGAGGATSRFSHALRGVA